MAFCRIVSRIPFCITKYTTLSTNSTHALHLTLVHRDIYKIQDKEDFDTKVLGNSNLVILDFYATWCGPCKLLTPRLENLIGSLRSKNQNSSTTGIDLAKVDVDELDEIAGRYNVSAIPAVFAIKRGKVVDSFVGLKDEDQLEAFLEAALHK